MNHSGAIWSYEFEKDKKLSSGKLLLAEPFMYDPNFRRSVTLICNYAPETGTVGLMINRPVNIPFNEIVHDFPTVSVPIFVGGPVGMDTIQFLHTFGDELEGSISINGNLYWGGNFEHLKELAEQGCVNHHNTQFYIGYSGWSEGQLEQELKDSSWIIADAQPTHIFRTEVSGLWKEILTGMGGVYATMANYPESPILN